MTKVYHGAISELLKAALLTIYGESCNRIMLSPALVVGPPAQNLEIDR